MKIGIAYDTFEMYDFDEHRLYYDFAEQASINKLCYLLNKLGYQAELVGNTNNILNLIKNNAFNFQLIYNTVEGIGSRNREGLLPAILEAYKIPYIGTDSFGLSLTLNKTFTKILAEKLNITTPKYFCSTTETTKNQLLQQLKLLKLPVIIKPNFEGNSSGICVKDNYDNAVDCIMELCLSYQSPILCEEFIVGQEITVPMIGNSESDMIFAVTTVDIQRNGYFWLDVNCKVFGDYKNILVKSKYLSKRLSSICKKLFFTIGCKDFARIDFRIDENDNIYFIEVNPLPALFEGGSFDILGQSIGLSYEETLDLIIKTAKKRLEI